MLPIQKWLGGFFMNKTSYEFEVAISDKLLSENKISHEEWYCLLMSLREAYNLPKINCINIVDNNTK